MSASVKYTLGRIGIFLAVLGAMLPLPMHLLLKLMVALLISAVVSFFLLRGWRDEMAADLAAAADRRKAQRERLRSALAGEDRSADGPPES